MSQVVNLEKLFTAYLDCRESKRKTINALKFEFDLERKLFKLLDELKDKSYKPGRSICFIVNIPVLREIFAASFRDRIVHHLLVNEVKGFGERIFIFNSFACREKKGTHLAVKRLRRATKILKGSSFYLQIDIAGFFMSINHNILYKSLVELVKKYRKNKHWEEDVLWLAKSIIFHKPTKDYLLKGKAEGFKSIPKRKSLFYSGDYRGLPIGNYSSQFFANLYLNKVDQFIKRNLKCKFYFRYVDDLVILGKKREELILIKNKINQFLKENLNLGLNHNKTKINKIDKGIDFLGYFIKPNYMLVRKRVVKSLKNKLYYLTEKKLITIKAYFAHFIHANSFYLRERVISYA